jgi:uncharacterized membrane protein
MAQLLPLLVGIAIFIGGHLITRNRELRGRLIASKGENFYRTLYSMVALLGLAMIAHGYGVYRAAGYIQLWNPPRFLNHTVILLVWPAMILLVSTYAGGMIKARVKHPMLVAIKVWALAHLLVNGDLGSTLLFGSFLAWAVVARIRIKRAGEDAAPPAVVDTRRAQIGDAIAIVGGTALAALLIFWLHQRLFGVAVL